MSWLPACWILNCTWKSNNNPRVYFRFDMSFTYCCNARTKYLRKWNQKDEWWNAACMYITWANYNILRFTCYRKFLFYILVYGSIWNVKISMHTSTEAQLGGIKISTVPPCLVKIMSSFVQLYFESGFSPFIPNSFWTAGSSSLSGLIPYRTIKRFIPGEIPRRSVV